MKPATLVPLEVLKAFETVPDLYLVLSPELEVLTASDAFLWASRSGREEWMGKNLFGGALPGNLEQHVFSPAKVEDAFRQVLSGKKPHELSLHLHSEFPCTNDTSKPGEKFLRLHLTPGFNGHQELQYLLVKVEDQTELTLCRETVQAITRDNAQQKKAGEELKQNQQLLQATLDSSPDMIQVFEAVRDESGEIIDFKWVLNNHTSEKWYGNVIGQSLLQSNPGVRKKGIFDTFKRVVETGRPQQSERHYVHEQFNGWFFQSVVKLNDGVATTTTDISELKKAEKQIKTTKENLQATLDSSLYVIQAFEAVRNESGEIVDFNWIFTNNAWNELYGEMIGKSLLQQNPAVVETGLFEKFVQVTETGIPVDHEQFYSHEQFQDQWFHQTLVKMGDGFVMNTEDITQRKKAEEEINRLKDEIAQKATDKYKALFDSIDEGFAIQEVVTDENGNVTDVIYLEVNKAFEQISGMKEVSGKKASELLPHLEQHWLDTQTHVYKTGKPLRGENYTVDLGRWITYQFSRIGGAGSPLIGVVFNDITDRKQREQQQDYLLRLNDALRPIADPKEVQRVAMQVLGEHLIVDRAIYAEINIDEDWFETTDNYTSKSVHKVIGRFPFTALGSPGEKLKQGKSLIMHDVTDEVDDDSKKAYYSSNVHAVVAVPLIKQGKLVAALSVHQKTPRHWLDHEIALIQETAERTWAAVERAKAEAALRESEEKYRTLFETIEEAFCIMELVRNEQGDVVDVIYREVNKAFERHTGLTNVVGKRSTETIPNQDPNRFKFYQRLSETGETTLDEVYINDVNRWLRLYRMRLGGPESNLIAAVFEDITERKRREQQQEFLLQFSDNLRAERIADAVATRALEMLIEYLRLDRSYIVSYYLDKNIALLDYQIGNETVPPLPDTFDLSHYPGAYKAVLNQTLVIEDDFERQGLSENEKQNSATLGMRAMVAATVRKRENKPLWSMVAINSKPRHWTPDEVRLVEEVAERTWAAVERAKAEEALHKSEEKYRSLFESIDEGFAIQEVLTDQGGNVVDLIYREVNEAFEQHTGMKNALGKKASELVPHLEQHWLHALTQVYKTGKPLRSENYAADLNRWITYQYSRIGGEGSRLIAAVFNDITQRKQQEQQQAFLLRLSDALRTLPDAASIKDQAVRMLAGHLRLDRCYISEVFEQKGISTVGPEHIRPDLSPMSGVFQLSDYPETMRQLVMHPIVIEDVAHDPSFSDSEKELLAGLQLRALLVVPLRKGESQVIWALAAAMATPRFWTYHERMLLEETVERTWAAVERAEAERALADSEEQFRRAIEDAPIPVIMHAEDGEVLQISHSWTELTGYRQEEVPTFDHWLTQAYGEGAEKVRSHMQHLFTGHRRTVDIDFPVRTLRGEVRHWSFSASSPGTLKDGRRFIVGMAVDITERRRAEEQLQEFNAQLEQQVTERTKALQESKELLEASANTSPLGMVVVKSIRNASGRIMDFEYVWLNAVSREMAGEDVTGLRMLQLYPHIKEIGLFDAYVKAVDQNGRVDFEENFSLSQRWFRWLAVKLDDGLFISVEDITERKKAEKSVAEHLTLLRQSEEVARMGSWEYNLQTGVYRWSDGMYRLFGLPLDAPVHPETYLEYVVEEDRGTAREMVEGLRQGREPKEDTFRVKVGEAELLLKIKGVALRNGQGEVEKVLGVDLDLSEVHRLEQENLRMRLEQQKALLLAILEAQEEERRRISESLHNGVAQILYATKLNLGRAKEHDVESGKEENQPLQTVEDLLTEAINETRRVSHELVPMLLQEFGLQVALESMCRKFEDSALFLQCKVEGLEQRLEPYLEIALFRMSQELVNNILKHSGATAATLSICKEGEHIQLQARDNGRGIKAGKSNGKGIGLKSIKDRVKLLNGTLSVSAPKSGKGTLITIQVPARF
ncbi:PAS domain S-box protein [Rufibacter aurantiacus]|uniref:PAS domain S-box protein n=1 Tax=Rufibacter aurantiacus TaxID=2817374 RepID=UPI001B301F3F|nr:PAS domain S-box protein [Rufibacter aurantiacus]